MGYDLHHIDIPSKQEFILSMADSLVGEALENYTSKIQQYYLNEDDIERFTVSVINDLHDKCRNFIDTEKKKAIYKHEKAAIKQEVNNMIDRSLKELAEILKKIITDGDATFEAW